MRIIYIYIYGYIECIIIINTVYNFFILRIKIDISKYIYNAN
jgi:hypothetical protein